MSTRTRTIRYGAAALLVIAGAACGVSVPGTAGGTLATVLVGLGLVLAVSLVFYEVGLTEDRDRARAAVDLEPRREERSRRSPGPLGADRSHQRGRPRPPERRRGQRRRLD